MNIINKQFTNLLNNRKYVLSCTLLGGTYGYYVGFKVSFNNYNKNLDPNSYKDIIECMGVTTIIFTCTTIGLSVGLLSAPIHPLLIPSYFIYKLINNDSDSDDNDNNNNNNKLFLLMDKFKHTP